MDELSDRDNVVLAGIVDGDTLDVRIQVRCEGSKTGVADPSGFQFGSASEALHWTTTQSFDDIEFPEGRYVLLAGTPPQYFTGDPSDPTAEATVAQNVDGFWAVTGFSVCG